MKIIRTLLGICLIFMTLTLVVITGLGFACFRTVDFFMNADSSFIVFVVMAILCCKIFLGSIKGVFKVFCGFILVNILCYAILGCGIDSLISMIL